MDKQRWSAFDTDLRIRIEESRQTRYDTPQSTGNMDKNSDNLGEEAVHTAHTNGQRLDRQRSVS